MLRERLIAKILLYILNYFLLFILHFVIIMLKNKVSADGSGVYVGGELGGLIHLTRSKEDGSLTMTRAWAASDFDEALQVQNICFLFKFIFQWYY